METRSFINASAAPGPLWSNGPAPGQIYNFPGKAIISDNSSQRTMLPTVTTTSVLGIKFKDGVILAADMLGSYGSLARYRNCPRLKCINEQTIVGCGGDYADFQFLSSIVQQRVIDEECLDDGFVYTPSGLHSWLSRVLYNRRSQLNPLWNTYIVGGLEEDEPYLGYVDMIGVSYEADTLASGFGAYIALPVMRDAKDKNPNMDEKQAVELLERCMKLMYYRDARSLNKYQIAVVNRKGSEIRGPIISQTNWDIAHLISGYE